MNRFLVEASGEVANCNVTCLSFNIYVFFFLIAQFSNEDQLGCS